MKNINKIITKKNLCFLAIIVTIILTIPIVKLSFYTFPSADDFSYGINTINQPSFIKIIIGALTQVKESYNIWQGTYSAVFLFSLNPAVIGENYYFLTTLIIMIVFLISLSFLLYQLLYKFLKIDKSIFIVVCLYIFIFCIETIIDKTQGLFWWNGASYYMIFFSLELIEIGLLAKRYLLEKKSKYEYFILGVLILIIAGGNYVTALQQIILLGFLNIYLLFVKKDKSALPLLLLSIIGLGISAIAPGNAVRQKKVTGLGPITAIIVSFKSAIKLGYSWFSPITLLFLIGIEMLLYSTYNKSKFKYPLIVLIISYCIFSAQFTPSLYAQSIVGEGRLLNITYICYILLLVFNIYYFIGNIRNKLIEEKALSKTSTEKILSVVSKYKLIIIGIYFVAILITVHFQKDSYTSYISYRLLKTEEPYIYAKEWKNRYKILNNKKIKKVEFEPLTYMPYPISYADFTDDKSHWLNEPAIIIYDKDYIIVKKGK